MPTEQKHEPYASLVAAQEQQTTENVAVAFEAAALHLDVGQWHGQAAQPANGDVPGYWFRNRETGIASKVPLKYEDTIARCVREGYELIEDPTVTPGVPIFGQASRKKTSLA